MERFRRSRTRFRRLHPAHADVAQTQACWNKFEHEGEPGSYWWSAPGMQARWNRKITGNPNKSYVAHVVETYFADREPLTALTVGSGSGYGERRWAEHYRFQSHQAFDIAHKRVKTAQAMADAQGLTQLRYYVDDANVCQLAAESFDVVIFEQALHHVTRLEHLLGQVVLALRPGGLVVVNEFVGASRFQWPDRQLAVINAALQLLPIQYRMSCTSPGKVKPATVRPSLKGLMRSDPSEAARSAEIPALLHRFFSVLEWKPYGGGLLHLLLEDIAGNFSAESADDQALLTMCFQIEDTLTQAGELPTDFVFAVACKPLEHGSH